MPRPEKVRAVADIKERLESANAVFLAEYAGLSVEEQQDLRRGLRDGGAEFKVVKMSLARRAAIDLDIEMLSELMLGPTGIAFADDDAVVAAKKLRDFAKEHDVFKIKGGILGTEFLTPERIAQLADIETREVLLAKLAGVVKAPLSNVASLVAALPRGLATALQQLIDKLPEAEADSTSEVLTHEDDVEEGVGESVELTEEPTEAGVAASDDVAESIDEPKPDVALSDIEDQVVDTDDGDVAQEAEEE